MIDPDKKVEKGKRERRGIYQSSQHPEHFTNEGSEYENIPMQDNNDIRENADYDQIHGIKKNPYKEDKKETEIELKESDDSTAGTESGIPGTTEKENIGTASSGAGLGGNKGRGTTDFPGKQ